MRIAVLGMGNVGSTLGQWWRKGGHQAAFGVRDPMKKKADPEKIQATVTTIPGATAGAQAVLLAIPWTAAPTVLEATGDLSGKVLLDCTNPVTPDLTHLTISRCETSVTPIGSNEMAKKLNGVRIAILATDGFEQSELERPREAFDAEGADTKVVSPVSKPRGLVDERLGRQGYRRRSPQ